MRAMFVEFSAFTRNRSRYLNDDAYPAASATRSAAKASAVASG